ncbi:MAG: glycosyltransferase, partial [Ruminococcus flavefaciens]|nr:glycosyltransferase [Ruminococcus flavefaciens]
MKISFVVPCYNEEENVELFFREVKMVMQKSPYDYEVIFINDGSRDKTLENLKKIYTINSTIVKVVNFSRNFGKEAAILSGLRHSDGDYITIIDADLQQSPEMVINMVDFLENNGDYDCVAAYQEHRLEAKKIKVLKNLFYKLINKVCNVEFVSGASDFRTFRHSMVEAIISLPEYFRFSKGLFSWVGYNTYYMPYEVRERNSGSSKWTFKALMRYALEGFISFTVFPLKIATVLGSITSCLAIVYLFVVIYHKIVYSDSFSGYPTIVGLILLFGGVQLFVMGIMGEYIARIYVQGKNRPIYIEKDFLDSKRGGVKRMNELMGKISKHISKEQKLSFISAFVIGIIVHYLYCLFCYARHLAVSDKIPSMHCCNQC